MSKSLTIGQVAAAIGVCAHTLRYYEQAGLLRAIGRSDAGHRLYSPADLDWLQFVMRLKATGMPIAAIKAFAELRAQGESTYAARRQLLAMHQEAVVARIAALQANLAAVADKIQRNDAASAGAARHDDISQPQRNKDSSWTSDPIQRPRPRTAMRGAGKS